jgi:low temperature requirement protein LtrA
MFRLAPFFLAAPLVAVPGAFLDGRARAVVWLVSLAIDVGGTLTAGDAGFRVSPAHFAERYALFVIIALGESVVAIGVAAESLPRDWTFFGAVSIAFALAAVLWWSYFDFPALAAARSLRFASPEKRAPLARDLFTFFHFPNVLGVIYIAVAAKKAIAHPSEPLSGGGRAALALGIGLFLLQFVLGRLRVIHRVSWERIAGIAAAAALVVAGRSLDAVWLLALALGVVVATTAAETVRLGQARAQVRAGGPPVPRARPRRASRGS